MDEIILRLKKHYFPLLALVLLAGLFFYFNRGNRNIITIITQAYNISAKTPIGRQRR
jgi:hypothetical protein